MRIHTMPVTCDVCGGDGLGTIRAASAMWDPYATVAHSNPAVCRAVLDRKRRDLERDLAAPPRFEVDRKDDV